MKYFDCDCLVGLPKVPLPNVKPDVADLLAEMGRLDIDQALVRHRICLEADHEIGNAVLMEEVSGHDNLIPAWYVTSDGLQGEFNPVAMVERMLEVGIGAAWTTSGDREAPYLLEPWCAGKLLSALQQHRVPLLLPCGGIPPNTLQSVLSSFPELTIILLQVPRLGRNPVIYALMEQHHNLVLCVNASYSVHRGLEDLYENFGPDRIVFGSGYPESEGGASIAALTYAELPTEVKQAIAYQNLERILARVQI